MSNFTGVAINPANGRQELASFLDNYYGRYRYGVRFADGGVYPVEQVAALAPTGRETSGEETLE